MGRNKPNLLPCSSIEKCQSREDGGASCKGQTACGSGSQGDAGVRRANRATRTARSGAARPTCSFVRSALCFACATRQRQPGECACEAAVQVVIVGSARLEEIAQPLARRVALDFAPDRTLPHSAFACASGSKRCTHTLATQAFHMEPSANFTVGIFGIYKCLIGKEFSYVARELLHRNFQSRG